MEEPVSARKRILSRVRAALGRSQASTITSALPPVLLASGTQSDLIHRFRTRLELLNGVTHEAADLQECRAIITGLTSGRCTWVSPGVPEFADLHSAANIDEAEIGITGADYALADTGTLVTFAASDQRRASLLPPLHIAILRETRILSGLDELLSTHPRPSEITSSMVLITGPSRTGDIEQILVRGVHGPGELHVVVINDGSTRLSA
jgi:L-lactate dehydrogenase complex protein LldG